MIIRIESDPARKEIPQFVLGVFFGSGNACHLSIALAPHGAGKTKIAVTYVWACQPPSEEDQEALRVFVDDMMGKPADLERGPVTLAELTSVRDQWLAE
jgi:hypothetical protein